MYFERFPKIARYNTMLTDISIRTKIKSDILSSPEMITDYKVTKGQKIEDVSYDFYSDPEYHWIIMLSNGIIDPFFDWVLEEKEFERHLTLNYTTQQLTEIHHYELGGVAYASSVVGSSPISYRTVEDRINEAKRNIILVRPEFIEMIEADIEKLIQ